MVDVAFATTISTAMPSQMHASGIMIGAKMRVFVGGRVLAADALCVLAELNQTADDWTKYRVKGPSAGPAGPSGPVGPVGPVAPCAPCGPGAVTVTALSASVTVTVFDTLVMFTSVIG